MAKLPGFLEGAGLMSFSSSTLRTAGSTQTCKWTFFWRLFLVEAEIFLQEEYAVSFLGRPILDTFSIKGKVPPGLPKLQWIGHTFDNTAAVYPDIGAALRKFKDDLVMHCLSPDYHWRRLITASLNTDHRGWLDDLPTNRHITWDEFCTKYRDTFGIDEEDEQQQAEEDLQAIRMEPTEELDHFIDRFMQIRRKAGRMDGKKVTTKFIKALNPMLNQVVGVAIAGWSRHKRSSMTKVIRITKKMKATLGNNNAAAPREPSQSNGVNQWQRYAENNGGPSRQGGNQDVMTCPFHEGEPYANKNHNPATCAEFAKATKAFSRMNLNQGIAVVLQGARQTIYKSIAICQ
ncbi:unnamed protein product [Mucor hiemalis]